MVSSDRPPARLPDAYPCPRCGSTSFTPGFVDDTVSGRVRWLAGRFQRGLLGNAKGRGLGRGVPVLAYRCTGCSRLELFAVDPEA
ncbi:hypothetical protein [Nocardioides litoris]|uniref:hypothetical protein n=1 Tax=Nocardioides litoris TaxID=1926648 RepID=UPI001B8644FF|nr:hypothetical protein [Nocardioides litoris]